MPKEDYSYVELEIKEMPDENYSFVEVDLSDESKEGFWVRSQKSACYNDCVSDTKDRGNEPTCDQKCGL